MHHWKDITTSLSLVTFADIVQDETSFDMCLLPSLVPSYRQHLSYGNCLEDDSVKWDIAYSDVSLTL